MRSARIPGNAHGAGLWFRSSRRMRVCPGTSRKIVPQTGRSHGHPRRRPTEKVRLLLAFTDATNARKETRQYDQLIREWAIVLQEVQHRIANSLQIIAGLLMQGARRVQSDEARQCLSEAHHRGMAVATVQKQLSATGDDTVDLTAYLTRLCDDLASSMFSDPSHLSIRTSIDDCVVSGADASSLGLIVT